MNECEIVEAEIVDEAPSSALTIIDEVVRPLVTPEQAKLSMAEYLALCESVLTEDDYQEFPGKKKINGRWVPVTNRFKKKSAVKKLQTFFGLEVTIKSTDRDDIGDGHFAFRVIASARTRGGRIVDATGGCSTMEERFELVPYDDESNERFAARQKKALARAYHDVLATAETRATNRAVMNAIGVGGGEVTADEVSRDPPQRQATPSQANRPAPSSANEPPATPPDPEAALKARRQRMGIYCRENGIFTAQRRTITEALFPHKEWAPHEPGSSKALDAEEMELLARELAKIVRARGQEVLP